MNPILLSYPRSGSHWLSYCIAQAFNVEILEAAKGKCVRAPFPYPSEPKASFIKRHGHESNFWTKEIGGPCLLILRNPLECIPRHLDSKRDEAILGSMSGKDLKALENATDYITILEYYDKLKSCKGIVYYEDLIQNPVDTIKSLSNFFSAAFSLDYSGSFEDNLSILTEKSLNFYNTFNKSQTMGKHITFHSRNLNTGTVDLVWHHLDSNFRLLTKKYLEKYRENNS